MLSISNVSKSFGKTPVLEDVNLDFGNGICAFLAPNGAGKTTLIKMLATLLFPTKGEILWNGVEIVSLGEAYRNLIGYLPQEFGYYKGYTPQEYLRYLAALKGVKGADARIDELLEMVSLSDVKRVKMRKFSGGVVQRVGIAQALLNDPKILILDEPTAGLDPKERVRLRNIIAGLSGDRIVIFSTHIVSDIESIANNLVMLKDHKVMYAGAINKLTEKMRGKTFELPATGGLPKDAVYLSERMGESGSVVRFVLEEGSPPEGAVAVVAPGLEDAFLYIYR